MEKIIIIVLIATMYSCSVTIDEESCEEYMERIGFDTGNCHWMVHEKGGVEFAI